MNSFNEERMPNGMYYPPVPSMKPARITVMPKDEKYKEQNRLWQGCPSVEVTKGGRIWVTWFTGGPKEPHPDTYPLLAYSDDGGKSFVQPYLVIESDVEHYDRVSDSNLWIDPDGRLWLIYVQSRISPAYHDIDQMYELFDGFFGAWAIICDDPDAETPHWSEPRRLCHGYPRNRITVMSDGRWILPAYDWIYPTFVSLPPLAEKADFRFTYYESLDKGETWERKLGPEKDTLIGFDEQMMYEGMDGKWYLLARTSRGIARGISEDKGKTWGSLERDYFPNASSRFFVRRLNSGRLLLINYLDLTANGLRNKLVARLSEDDGKTWGAPLMIDERDSVTYPDGVEAADGYIYIAYDRERYGAREILLTRFTEEDILAGDFVKEGSYTKRIISKIGR